jgi:hypothetical protein
LKPLPAISNAVPLAGEVAPFVPKIRLPDGLLPLVPLKLTRVVGVLA